jgi:hypothetical protein
LEASPTRDESPAVPDAAALARGPQNKPKTSVGAAAPNSAPAAAAPGAAPPKGEPNCAPPFYFDAKGNRVFKQECL